MALTASTPLSRRILLSFFAFVLNCRFYCFSRLIGRQVSLEFFGRIDGPIF